jgi:hypothetical protein
MIQYFCRNWENGEDGDISGDSCVELGRFVLYFFDTSN